MNNVGFLLPMSQSGYCLPEPKSRLSKISRLGQDNKDMT